MVDYLSVYRSPDHRRHLSIINLSRLAYISCETTSERQVKWQSARLMTTNRQRLNGVAVNSSKREWEWHSSGRQVVLITGNQCYYSLNLPIAHSDNKWIEFPSHTDGRDARWVISCVKWYHVTHLETTCCNWITTSSEQVAVIHTIYHFTISSESFSTHQTFNHRDLCLFFVSSFSLSLRWQLKEKRPVCLSHLSCLLWQ